MSPSSFLQSAIAVSGQWIEQDIQLHPYHVAFFRDLFGKGSKVKVFTLVHMRARKLVN